MDSSTSSSIPDLHTYRHYTCPKCGYSFDAPVYCGNRFCTTCGVHRLLRVRRKLRHIAASVKPELGYKVRHLTLTIPNCNEVSDGAKLLVESFRRLRQRRFWQNRVNGGAWVIEVTGSPHRWHVHLHAMLECRYIPVRLLSKHWQRVSPGKIVYLKNLPPSAIINYLTKYLSKSELPADYQREASDGLRGVRLFQPFGTWHGLAASVPKLKYSCPDCGYAAFYYNPTGINWERRTGRSPPDPWTRYRRDVCIHRNGPV